MTVIRKRHAGVSLLEVMLVLVIGAGILFFSLRQYQVFKRDADLQQLEANVDTLFQAMAQYYKANCYGKTDPTVVAPTAGLTPGTLNPMNATSPLPGPYPINIDNMLVSGGYLSSGTPFPASPIVDDTGPASSRFNGYVAQFNANTSIRTTNGVTAGTILIWKPQIAVKIKDTTLTQQYLNELKGDCLSTLNGSTVRRCVAGSTGTYIVWERMPSYATVRANSSLSQGKVVSNQFTQMYTVYPTPYLLNKSGLTPTGQTQYYLCGG